MNFQSIRRSFENMDYSRWVSPATAIVFVPGLSFVAQKIQMAHLLPIPAFQGTFQEGNWKEVFTAQQKVRTVLAWHLVGSIAQTYTWMIVALKVTALPLSPIMALAAGCELAYTMYNMVNYGTFRAKENPETRLVEHC